MLGVCEKQPQEGSWLCSGVCYIYVHLDCIIHTSPVIVLLKVLMHSSFTSVVAALQSIC